MSILVDLITGIFKLIDALLNIYKWIVIIAALISWVNPDPYNPIVRFLYSVTEPVLRPVRRFIGNRLGPIDISPLIVIIAIILIQSIIARYIIRHSLF
ncbi:MAG TPA: YggT family protein [Nitrospirae bacterium]|nr:YGGT family protein [bacterium BMS3Abin10]GBE37723.1 YGGT family protein [bacterium BMS3Bbin08]HDH50712.1 YggT family protein [Nitrospirota bacterium]HDK17625.1 YggT family protein [Nitrospirota bacterium]HDK82000.1 YggT family protein [Nitrospirota bacterium]